MACHLNKPVHLSTGHIKCHPVFCLPTPVLSSTKWFLLTLHCSLGSSIATLGNMVIPALMHMSSRTPANVQVPSGVQWPGSRSALYPPVLPTCPHQHQQSETGHSQCRWPSPSMMCTPRPTSLSVLANKTIPTQLVINCHSSQHLSQMQPHCQL